MINAIDFYKSGHRGHFAEKTEYVYGNLTPRSTKYAKTDYIVVAGLQGFCKKNLIEGFDRDFFNQPKEKVINKYKRRMDNALGVGVVPVDHLESLHDLGYLPVIVKGLPEGSIVPAKIPVLTIINTIPEFFWIVNYLETLLSAELWPTITAATIAYEYRRILTEYADKTGTPREFVAFQGHDFSFRGLPGVEASKLFGIGHLMSFAGTDTVPAIDYAEDYYNADSDKELVGCSVPATEHSVTTANIGNLERTLGSKRAGEKEFIRKLISEKHPAGIVSIVSDSFDYWTVVSEISAELKEEIRARKPVTDDNGNVIVPAKTTFRPDSGDPVKILTGYKLDPCTFSDKNEVYAELDGATTLPEAVKVGDKFFEIYQCLDGRVDLGKELTEVEVKGSVEVLWNIFGGTTTFKGFRQLNEVGLIYGDSITIDRAKEIMQRLYEKNFASGNVVLGIGSFTYQYNTRDTYGIAMKATWCQVDGQGINIYKDPKTDDGTKKSAKGLLRVEIEDGKYVLYDEQTEEQEQQGELQVIFQDGTILNETSLEEIRGKLWQ